ncbi:MAG TPA: thioredoxin domain-containing protein, partial [Ignavibacteriales bacterium]|nr:thioredoxin domain-containing protein [Ignavibacteriales bacterium]
GGTYFPPDDRYGRPGFPKLLALIYDAYKNQKDEIYSKKEEIRNSLIGMTALSSEENAFEFSDFDEAFNKIKDSYDQIWGGFGGAPKFPSFSILTFLLRYYSITKNEDALEMAENSLLQMSGGGIYDPIGGGFARYSTDERWTVPHFEKMLYDNALLSRLYLEAFQVTQNAYYLGIAEDIFTFLFREMRDQTGAFYSAIDADSESVEGKFYVYTYDELKSILTETEFNAAVKYFNLHEEGNFDGANVFTARSSIDSLAAEINITEIETAELIGQIRNKIFAHREGRTKPAIDDKILTNWNALLLSSFSLAYGITGKKKYLEAASQLGDFIWNACFKDETLYHSYKTGTLKHPGYLDNYSFLAEGFINLYTATFDGEHLERAGKLAEIIVNRFYDEKEGNFFYADKSAKDLILRAKDLYDNAIPSGNSTAILVLQRLSILLNKPEYMELVKRNLSGLKKLAVKYPNGFAYFLTGALAGFNGLKEIAVIASDALEMNKILRLYHNEFFPFTALAGKLNSEKSGLELLSGKELAEGSSLAIFVCENYSCKEPVHTFEELKSTIVMQ